MPGDWYCQVQGTTYGPLTSQDVKRMAESGKLGPTDLVRKTEAGKWVPAGSVKGLTFKPPAAEPVADSEDDAPAGKKCPSCRADLQPAAALCVNCGLDLRTGKRHAATPVAARSRPRAVVIAGVVAVIAVASAATYFAFIRPGSSPPPDSAGPPPGGTGGAEPTPGGAAAGDRAAAIRKDASDLLARLPRPRSTDVAERFNKRIAGPDRDTYDAWAEALQAATGEPVSREQAFTFVLDYEPVFTDDTFQPARSRQFVARLKRLPEDAPRRWAEAMVVLDPRFKSPDVAVKAITAGLIVAQDRLFAGDALRADAAEKCRARLATIPASAARAVALAINPKLAPAAELTMLELDIAVALTHSDSLFESDRFQTPRFDELLRELKALVPK